MEAPSQESREKLAFRNAVKELCRIFDEIDGNSDGLIDSTDLKAYLKARGYTPRTGEVEEYIWEVDDKMQGSIDFEAFKKTFERCWRDKADIEPRQLYNVILFSLYAGSGAKKMSFEGVMQFVYFQKGKNELKEQVQIIFGDAGRSKTGLTLREFLECITTDQLGIK